ncbi:hypothetical protein D3C87_1828010 [compost metagenome]
MSDANGVSVTVPGGEHLRYRLTSGAAAEYAISLDNGSTLTPMIGLDIGVTGGMGSDLDSSGSFLGRFTTGLQFATGGLQLGVEFNTELDNGGFSSSTARAMIKGHF